MKKLSRPFLRPGEFTILLTCFIYPFPVFSSFKTQLKSPLIPLYQRGELHVIISESPPFVKGDKEAVRQRHSEASAEESQTCKMLNP